MIPLQLQLKNFLSYGLEFQTINFKPYNLICLSGKNGHGKSAILDSMTWALWGQARKVTGAVRADQSLLRLGTTKMVVIFDFAFNGNTYRVKREFYVSSSSKSFSVLEFGMFDEDEITLIPLTDKTIRQTQKKIEQTIGLDFETFINSAFIRQGNANEFSKKSPRDRKDILGKILSLEKYEILRKHAADKAKKAVTQKEVLRQIQEKRVTHKEQLANVENDYKTLQKDIKVLVENAQKIEKEEKLLQEKEKKIASQTHEHLALQKENKQLEAEQNTYWKEVKKLHNEWRAIRRQKKQTDTDALQKKQNSIITAITKQQQDLQEKLTHEKELLQLTADTEKIKHTYTNAHAQKVQKQILQLEQATVQISQLKKQITQYEKKIESFTQELKNLEKEQITADKNIKTGAQTKKEIEQITKQFEKRKNSYQSYAAQGNMFRSQLSDLKTKRNLSKHENNPCCPLCEQNLSASRRRFLKEKFDTEFQKLTHKLNRIAHIIPTLKSVIVEQHAQLQTLQKKSENLTKEELQQQDRIKTIVKITQEQKNEQTLLLQLNAEHKSDEKKQETAQKEISSLEKEIPQYNKDEKFIALKTKIVTTEKIIAQNAYNEKTFRSLQKEQAIIEKQLINAAHYKEEQKKQDERKHTITNICDQLRKIKQTLQTLQKKEREFVNLEKEKISLTSEIKDVQKKKDALILQKETLVEKRGRLENALAQKEQLKKEYTQEEKRIEELHKVIEDYSIIATAAGKEGIQALLIENAIPEIEHEANRLLSKLTNNNTQINIESLRDLKKGGTKETLDIKISDPAGIRSYELFSGGEAFRIDLALRIAISKLLARRAGTALQTLIIDEGFGSQDEEGLYNIMDAIYKIQDDFCKIIIVSHLPAMKDNFPVHFHIEKLPQGSTVNVIEQG